MHRACLLLLAGVYAPQLTSFALDSDLLMVALVAFFGGLVGGRMRALLVFGTGTALFAIAADKVIESRLPTELAGDSIVTQVKVTDFPKRNGGGVQLVVEPIDDPRLPQRLRLSWLEPPVTIRLGDVWQLELRLRRPRGRSNPGVFDFEAWLFRDKVGAIGYVVNGNRNHLRRSHDLGLVQHARQRVVDRISRLIPETDSAAVLIAISVGARHLMTPDQWQRYAVSGTSHLMAISGLHVGLAAAGGYVLVSAIVGGFWRRRNGHIVATVVAVMVAVAYAVFSGLAVPARRASVMLALGAAAIAARHPIRPFAIVATACVCVVVSTPLETMAPGFKLSFAAVVVLIWLGRRSRGKVGGRPSERLLAALSQLVMMQLNLFISLLPLTVLLFDRIAIAAPVANLVAVPVFSLVTVPFCLVGVVFDGPLRIAGDQALQFSAASLELIEQLITGITAISGVDVSTPAISGSAWLFVVLPLCWVALPAGWPGRSVALVAIAALILFEPQRPPAACVDIEVLDVGQGLAVVVIARRQVVVYDTGPWFRGGGSAARSVILPYLRGRGVERIDKLVISHADLDHAGGVHALISNVDVREVLAGEALPRQAGPALRCVAGASWHDDGVTFEIVHPPAFTQYRGNDASCVLLVTAGSHRALLPGDIERPVEEELVRRQALQAVDLVIVPHHGSRTSSGLPFVSATRPAVAIVSAGYGNRWGFPKSDIVARWHAAGADVLTTATSGSIGARLCADGGLVSLHENRLRRRRIWHE